MPSTCKHGKYTDVCVITDADLDRALTNVFRLAEASDRDFDYLKSRSLSADLLPPMQRLANFLLAIVGVDVGEGREPRIVTDDVSSGCGEQLQC